MTPQISPEMHAALAGKPDSPLVVEDAETKARYVLIPEAMYEKVQPLVYDDSDPNVMEFLPLAHEAFREDWDAPGMSLYDDYDSHRGQS